VFEQYGAAQAEPRFELRIESEGVQQRFSLRSVVLGPVKHRPPSPLRRRNNLAQPLAGIAVGNDLRGIKAQAFQTIKKRLNILLAGKNRIPQDGIGRN